MMQNQDRNTDFLIDQAMAYLAEIEGDLNLTRSCEQMQKIEAFCTLITHEGSGFDSEIMSAIQSIKSKAQSILEGRSPNTVAH